MADPAKQAEVKQDDTAPDIIATLKDANGVVNLTGATVQWRIKPKDGSGTAIVGTCTVAAPLTGVVTHDLNAQDTITPGTYYVEYLVTWASGEKTTFPKDYANTLLVRARSTI